MKIYGIKTCKSVKKAIKFFEDKGAKFELIDLKKNQLAVKKLKNG